jgi:hypothetical protein
VLIAVHLLKYKCKCSPHTGMMFIRYFRFVLRFTPTCPKCCRLFRFQAPMYTCLLNFVDLTSRYKFLVITNLTHLFMYLFISCLYVFRASQRSSSGDRTVLIHHLVWLVCVSYCLVCRSGMAYPAVTQTNRTRWRINAIRSPDDERRDAWNMYRH